MIFELKELGLSEYEARIIEELSTNRINLRELSKRTKIPFGKIYSVIKKLKEKSLVTQEDKKYTLSLIGKILVNKMKPLVSVIDVFEDNLEYWTERDLQGIPFSFRIRIGELGKSKLIQPDLDRMFEIDPEIVENFSKSTTILECIAYFNPSLISLFQDLAKSGAKISFIMSESVFQRCSEDYLEDLQKLLTFKNLNFFLYSGELRIVNLTVTDRFFLLSLFPKNQKHFDLESLLSYEPSALRFGEELFNELLKNSTQVTQVTAH